jgi:hypothetical protein
MLNLFIEIGYNFDNGFKFHEDWQHINGLFLAKYYNMNCAILCKTIQSTKQQAYGVGWGAI